MRSWRSCLLVKSQPAWSLKVREFRVRLCRVREKLMAQEVSRTPSLRGDQIIVTSQKSFSLLK